MRVLSVVASPRRLIVLIENNNSYFKSIATIYGWKNKDRNEVEDLIIYTIKFIFIDE